MASQFWGRLDIFRTFDWQNSKKALKLLSSALVCRHHENVIQMKKTTDRIDSSPAHQISQRTIESGRQQPTIIHAE